MYVSVRLCVCCLLFVRTSKMALEKMSDTHNENKQSSDNIRNRLRKEKAFQTKVVIRRLPPSMTEEQFLMQINPVPDNDYLQFVKADSRLGHNAFSRAYLNFANCEDLFVFKDTYDNYVFLDNKGNEYPAVVEFAQFQKIPRKRNKKKDPKSGTIDTDPDYTSFVENLKNPDSVSLPTAEVYLEEIETREKELRANNGVAKVMTPLLEYIKQRKIEQQRIREEKREERKRRELERKRLREEERRRRKTERDKLKEKLLKEKDSLSEKESLDEGLPDPLDEIKQEIFVQVLKNPERVKEAKETPKPKEVLPPKDKTRSKKDWDYGTNEKSKLGMPKDKLHERSFTSWGRKSEKTEFKSSYASSTYKPVGQTSSSSSHSGATTFYPSSKRNSEESTTKKGKISTEKSPPKAKKERIFYSKKAETSKDVLDETCRNEDSKNKDPRTERRIRNKDRPSMEIYRPGMRRFSSQRSSPQKEVSASTSNSSSPSPTPPLSTNQETSSAQQTDDLSK